MRIALTGVSGFIGSRIAGALVDNGHAVNGLVRSTSRRDHIEDVVDRFVIGDHSDQSCWPQLLDGADCIIHNSVAWPGSGASGDQKFQTQVHNNLVSSLGLLHASPARQFIFMSTVAVHHDIRPRWQGVIDEDHPLRPSIWYGAQKAAVEPHLWVAHYQDGRNTSAFRPCAVYGIDPKFDRSIGYPIIKQLVQQRMCNRQGGGKFVHVDDVAAAVAAAVGNPSTAGKPYNLVDCYARWADLAQFAAEYLEIDAKIDSSSPPEPKNQFSKDAAGSLGITLDRGHEGLRAHIHELTDLMREAGKI